MKNLSIFLITGLFLLTTATGCCARGPWRGKVIDAETKQPIEGVVVVAIWNKSYRGPAGTTNLFLAAREALTGKDGRFEIPSFSALHIPFFREISGPEFTIYKPGYGFPKFISEPQGADKDITPVLAFYEHVFEKKEDVVELALTKTNEERKEILIDAQARTGDVPTTERKNLKKLIDAENVFLGLTHGK